MTSNYTEAIIRVKNSPLALFKGDFIDRPIDIMVKDLSNIGSPLGEIQSGKIDENKSTD